LKQKASFTYQAITKITLYLTSVVVKAKIQRPGPSRLRPGPSRPRPRPGPFKAEAEAWTLKTKASTLESYANFKANITHNLMTIYHTPLIAPIN